MNFWVQSNGAVGPSLQIAYLGTDITTEDDSLDMCVEFIEQKMGIPVGPDAIITARGLRSFMSDFGVGYHIKLPPHILIPRWEAEPCVTSNFIVEEEPSYDIVRPYLEQAFQTKNACCLLLMNVMLINNTPYPGEPYGLALDYTCFGDFQMLATNQTKILMEERPMGATDIDYWAYYIFLNREEDKCRYWPDYPQLMELKMQLDPNNRFDVYQGIHTSESSVHGDGDCNI